MSHIRSFSLVTLLAALLLTLGITPALATSPVTTSGIVTDPTGWLNEADRTRIEDAAREARSKGVSVDVVIVDDFSGIDGVQWCRQTLSKSGTTDGNIIYYLAYSQREDGECVNGGSISASVRADARRAAEAKLTSNPLSSSDAASGAVAFIDHLVSASSDPSYGSTRTSRSRTSSTTTSGNAGKGVLVAFIVIIGFVVIAVTLASRGNQRTVVANREEMRENSRKKVASANQQLLTADEQVRTASDELDFARAQFGIAATDDFARTLDAAREAVARCFETQRQLEAATSDAARGALASSIMRDLGVAMNPLSAIQASFEQKRSEQATLPARVAAARERLTEQRADLERAQGELASIAGIYPPQMLASLQDNPEQADALLTAASSALDAAREAVDEDRARAESALDTAYRALMMAKHQTDAIFSAKSDLDAIRDRLGTAIGSISSDISDVSTLNTDPAVFSPLITDAQAAIAEGQNALFNNGDPLAALEHLRSSEATLDAALAPLRTKRDNDEKARATARSQVSLANSAVERATRYVQGRRGAMDLTVRSMLHNAQQSLQGARDALDKDPRQATALASEACSLADRVLATPIRSSSSGWDDDGNSYYGSTKSRSSLGDIILWSILSSDSGSSHSSSSWGSSSGGSSGGSSSSGGFSGSSGSFGGGGFSGSKGHF